MGTHQICHRRSRRRRGRFSRTKYGGYGRTIEEAFEPTSRTNKRILDENELIFDRREGSRGLTSSVIVVLDDDAADSHITKYGGYGGTTDKTFEPTSRANEQILSKNEPDFGQGGQRVSSTPQPMHPSPYTKVTYIHRARMSCKVAHNVHERVVLQALMHTQEWW